MELMVLMAFITGNIPRYMTDKWQQKFNYAELKLIISIHYDTANYGKHFKHSATTGKILCSRKFC